MAPVLSGRAAEIQALRSALDRARAGRGSLVVVSGEAGIGKSALVVTLASEAEALGLVPVWGRAWEFAEAPPYFPVWPCFKSLGLSPPDAGDREAFAMWERVLEGIARTSSEVLWILEDLHAADLQTLDLLAYLAQPLRGLRALVVATARPLDPRLDERAASRLHRMARDGIDLRLEPLALADVATVAESWAQRPLANDLVARLAERTGGNPLFVVECARALRGGDDLGLPSSLRQAVLDRVSALPEAARTFLGAGAIAGRDFSAALVAHMTGVLPARVIDALLPALRGGILTELHPGHFAFTHVLVRDAVEASLSSEEAVRLHARAASALASHGEGPQVVVERARHALAGMRAGDELGAVALAERAARHLEEQGAFDRAWALHRRIDEARRAGLVPDAPSPTDRLHVAEIAISAGRHAESRTICDEVLAIARGRGDAALFARAALVVGSELRPGIALPGLVRLLEEALERLGGGDAALRIRVLGRLAAALQPAPDPEVPKSMAREAIDGARRLGDDRLVLEALEVAGSALVDYATASEQRALGEELLDRATRAADIPRMLRARARLALESVRAGDFEDFAAQVDAALALSVEIGLPRHRWRPLLLASMRACVWGDFAVSDRHLVEVAHLAASSDDPALTLSLQAHRLQRARLVERDDEIRASLDGIRGMPDAEVALRSVLAAGLHARLEERASAEAAIRAVGSRTAELEIWGALSEYLAEAYALAGTDEARQRLRAVLLPYVDGESHGGHVAVTYEGSVERLVALLDASLGDLRGAEARLRRSLEKATARGHRPWVARLRYEVARVLVQAGRAADAAPLFAQSAVDADDLGMTGLAARARRAGGGEPVGRTVGAAAVLGLGREGDVWRVTWGDRIVRVRDNRGMELLSRLVERSGEEIHVLVLASDEGAALVESNAGEALDPKARAAYRERLEDLKSAEADAEDRSDLGRIEAIRREREMIEAELSRAVGLGGRERKTGSATERARVNVQRRLKDAIARISELDEALGTYLARAVRTGTYCCFRP